MNWFKNLFKNFSLRYFSLMIFLILGGFMTAKHFDKVSYLALKISNQVSKISNNQKENDIKDELEEEVDEKTIPVSVTTVETRNIQKVFVTYSNLNAWKEVKVAPENNSTVKSVNVQLGEKVVKGQIIAELGSEVANLKKELKKLESELQEKEFKSLMALAKKNFIAKHEVYMKKMEIKANKLREDISELESNSEHLISPIDGVISELTIKEGDYIDGNAKYFVKVSDMQGYKIELHLPRVIAGQITIGEEVEVIKQEMDSEGEVKQLMVQGKVMAISPQIDPKTGTVFTEIAITGDDKPNWLIGSYVKVSITTDFSDDVLAIRNESIIYEKQKPVIYRVIASEKGEKAEKLNIELGLSDGRYTEIISGADDGDDIVVEGQGGLQNSSKVEIVNF
ncbi:efflux RND transporter periplasmic adaptor subunit [Bacteriovoracaceae bacterium]|nr:efflux RND transporter periplasmic adaptor subunit [Bacteriovoracaceae bacterium]